MVGVNFNLKSKLAKNRDQNILFSYMPQRNWNNFSPEYPNVMAYTVLESTAILRCF